MVYIRGAKEDYEHWAALGNEGWSYEEVLPFFKKAQNRVKGANEYHAQGGPLTVSPPRSPNPLNDMFINRPLTKSAVADSVRQWDCLAG